MPRVLVSGSTGLVGTALIPKLQADGWTVTRLVRPASAVKEPGSIVWDPSAQTIESGKLEGFDAVIHLAGESIAAGRWNAAKKERIRTSRVDATRFLAQTLSHLKTPPKIFISSSAIGYYGDRGTQTVDEASPAGQSFLAQVCQEWENASDAIAKAGARVVFVRTGIVLSPKGGALAKMLPPFKMGLGGKIGSGDQYMSWIDLDDLVGTFMQALKNASLSGPVNAVAPFPVTNEEFTKTLGQALSRPTIFPMPAFAARLAFGEMADALLLTGARVVPTKLSNAGYSFLYPSLSAALTHLLNG